MQRRTIKQETIPSTLWSVTLFTPMPYHLLQCLTIYSNALPFTPMPYHLLQCLTIYSNAQYPIPFSQESYDYHKYLHHTRYMIHFCHLEHFVEA